LPPLTGVISYTSFMAMRVIGTTLLSPAEVAGWSSEPPSVAPATTTARAAARITTNHNRTADRVTGEPERQAIRRAP
jgi:hypothetical protein